MKKEEIKEKLDKDFQLANPYMSVVDADTNDLSEIQENINVIRQQATKKKGVNAQELVNSYIKNVVGKKFELDAETIKNLQSAPVLKQDFGVGRQMLQPLTLRTADEIEALLKSVVGDQTYGQNLAQLNLAQKKFQQEQPQADTAAEVTGTALSIPLLAKTFGSAIQKAVPTKQYGFLPKLTGYSVASGLVAGSEGAAGANPSDRLRSAKNYGSIGALLGGGGLTASKLLDKTPLPDYVSKQFENVFGGSKIAQQADLETLRALQSDGKLNFDNLLTRLNEMQKRGKPVSLTDVSGEETKALLSLTGKYPTSINPVKEFLETREGGQRARLMSDFKSQFKVDSDAFDLKEKLLNRIENEAKPIYRRIMQGNKTPIVDAELNSIINTEIFEDVYKTYRKNKLKTSARGTVLPEYKDIFPSEDVGITLEGLDFFKKALDREIGNLKYSRADNATFLDLMDLRKRLINRIDIVGPKEYKEARKIYSEKYEAEEALELGKQGLLKSGESAKGFLNTYNNLKSKSEKEAFKVGMFDEIREKIDTARANADGGTNVIAKLYQNKQAQDKYEGILGKNTYKELVKRIETEIKIKDVDRSLTSGSPTEPRQFMKDFLQENKNVSPREIAERNILGYIIKSADPLPEKARLITKNLIELNPEKQTEIINRLKSLDQKLFDEVAKRMGLATIGTTTATRGILD